MYMQLVDAGTRFEDKTYCYSWFLIEQGGQRFYRVAILHELQALTKNDIQEREGTLGAQWALLVGAHRARVNFLYTTCGIFDPEYLGIVQMYGAAANAPTELEAAHKAVSMIAAVDSALASYPQSRTGVPSDKVIRWYMKFMQESRNILAILGHPDPRTRKRIGSALEGGLFDESLNDLSLEQNEILFRGLAQIRESFVFQVNSEHIERGTIAQYLHTISQINSDVSSRRRGTVSASFSLGIPLIVNAAQGFNASLGAGQSHVASESNSQSHGYGNSHVDSQAHTDSVSQSVGHAITRGVSAGHTDSQAVTNSQSHTESQARSSSGSHVDSHSDSSGANFGINVGQNQSDTVSANESVGGSAGAGIPDLIEAQIQYAQSQGQAHSEGSSSGINLGINKSSSDGFSDSYAWSQMQGSADTVGQSVMRGSADSVGSSLAVTDSVVNTHGAADTLGKADGVSENWGEGHASGQADGVSRSQSGGQSLAQGISGGVVPGVSIGRSFLTEDHVADRLSELYGMLETQANVGSAEGGFMADVVLVTRTEKGLQSAAALVPPAFHGSNVARPVMPVLPEPQDRDDLLASTRAFMPLDKANPNGGEFEGLFWQGYATLLLPKQMAAYTAPAILQEGTLKIIAQIPEGMGFYPDMKGQIFLGHQYSPNTGLPTAAPLRLTRERLMHTIFAGNTGFGKTVCAERMALEVARNLNMRVVVLDFGFAWRKLLNVEEIRGRVDIRQLKPGVRPLRWNPLQIGTYIDAESQMKAFADIFGTVAQLGQKQQQHRLLDCLRQVYLQAGVLVNDPEVRQSPRWGQVKDEEEAALVNTPKDTALGELTPEARQKLAVQRSKRVGLIDLYDQVQATSEKLPRHDQFGKGILDGILWRLRGMTTGEAAALFASNSKASEPIPIEDLGRENNSITIIEGGKFLDAFSKAWLLGWAGWLIYTDMVVRREMSLSKGEPDLFLVYEEANIIFSGLEGGDAESRMGPTVSEQQANMFRDARKYGAYFAVVTQSPSLLPPGVVSSCQNLVVNYLSNAKDKDVILAALPRSEKGFHDEPWRRFLSDLQIGMAIGRFPYTESRLEQLPVLFRPLMVSVPDVTDEEIEQILGRIPL
jgi:hypothetical protein